MMIMKIIILKIMIIIIIIIIIIVHSPSHTWSMNINRLFSITFSLKYKR